MAATALTPIVPTLAGAAFAAPATADNVNGNTFANNGKTRLRVVNADGAATHTITFTLTTYKGYTLGPDVRTIAISADIIITGLDPDIYGTQVVVTANSTQIKFAVIQ